VGTFGTVYTIGSKAQAASSGPNVVITVATPSSQGDAIIIGASSNAAPGDAVTGVTDTQGNTYAPVTSQTANGPVVWAYIALNAKALTLTGNGGSPDQITVAYSGSAVVHSAAAVGLAGAAAYAAVDLIVTAHSASGAVPPQALSSSPPGWAQEAAFAILANSNGGGTPTWASGWTGQVTAHTGSSQYLSVASAQVANTAPVSVSAGVTGTPTWSMIVFTVRPAVYLAGSVPTSGTTTITVPITQATNPGDTLAAAVSTSGMATILGVTDSKGNKWQPAAGVTGSATCYGWTAENTTQLSPSATPPDTVTITMSGSNAHSAAIVGVPGGQAGGVDTAASTSGTTSPASITSAPLSWPAEVAIAIESNTNSGGAASWAAGWTQVASVHSGSTEYLAVAYATTSSVSPVTPSASLVSAPWSMLLLTVAPVPLTAPPGPGRPVMARPGPDSTPRGVVRRSAGAPVITPGPPVKRRASPAGLAHRAPGPERYGRVRRNAGAPVTPVGPGTGPPVKNRTGPVPCRGRHPQPERYGRARRDAGAPAVPPGTVHVTQAWTAQRVIGTTFAGGPPAAASLDCPVNSAGGAWLAAFVSITLPPGFLGSNVGVADDVHGFWFPAGQPSGQTTTSDAAGFTRCSIWIRPAPGTTYPGNPWPATKHVYVYPTGLPEAPVYPAVIGVTVIEIAGMSPYAGIPAVVSATANDSASITADAGLPTGPALMLAVAASDGATFSSGAGPGWQSLPGTAVNGIPPAVLNTSPAWQVTSSDSPATWAVPGTRPADLSCCVAMILTSNPAPVAPNPNWPYTQLLIGLGSGATTPLDEITWTDITSRWIGSEDATAGRGKQYELDQTTAGQITVTLDNNDGNLDPENTASPYSPWLVADTPMCLQMTWQGRTQQQWFGYVAKLPQAWNTTTRFGVAQVTLNDGWALLTNQLNACQQEELLTSGPYALWPCGDTAGAAYAQNAAPGNTNALVITESKGGSGAAAAVFGANSGVNPGDPSATVWQQSGLGVNDAGQGFCLLCSDDNYPLLSGGISLMGWFDPVTGTQPSGEQLYLMKATNASTGDVFAVFLGNKTGYVTGAVYFRWYDRLTRQVNDSLVNSDHNWLTYGQPFHIALLATNGTWQVIVNGGANSGSSGGGSGSAFPVTMAGSFQWLTFCGSADRFYTGSMLNTSAYDLALFPMLLTADRVAQIVIAGWPQASGGQFPENPNLRIERLLGYGGWAGPRAISTTSATGMAPITDIQGSPGSISSSGQVRTSGGQTTSQAVSNIVVSDNGICYCDGNGVLCYISRADLWGKQPMWLLGELTTSGEYPVEADITFSKDKGLLFNTAQLTPSTGSGNPVIAIDQDSVDQHSTAPYTATVYQADIDVVADEANWIVSTRGEPQTRAESATVNAGANPANWPFVLGAEPGQPVQVSRRPVTAQYPVQVQAILTQVKRTFNFRNGVASCQVVTDNFPEGQVLIAGDPTYGQLNGQNRLAW
jgi:hypothetical protein